MNQRGTAPLLIVIVIGILALISVNLLSPANTPKQRVVSPQVTTTNIATSSAKLDQQKLEKYLTVEAALLGVGNNISLYFQDLKNNTKQISIDPSRSWIPASTIKAYVVLEAFRQKRAGLIDFNQTVTIKPENVVPTELDTDEFPRLKEGSQVTIKQLVEAMIIQSDNIAYNTLLDILDRRNINFSLRNIALTETVVGEKLNLDNDQLQIDLAVAGRQPNTTTVKDFATFFDLLYNKKIPDSEEILAIFKRQKINNMIPALLPQDTAIAHKTGEWAPIYHDGGIIYKPLAPFVLTVFSNSGDPNIVSELAKVAFYQSPEVVGQDLLLDTSKKTSMKHSKYLAARDYYLDPAVYDSVLGEKTEEKFPTITASDLGITADDVNIKTADSTKLRSALITPGSIFYRLKKFLEEKKLDGAKNNQEKVEANLEISKNRLAEVKTLLSIGDLASADQLIKQSEQNLEAATSLSTKDPNKDLLLLEIKQVSDLHFALLSERSQNIKAADKEKFINLVYNFYQNQKLKVSPIINASAIANPTSQKPAVGTIKSIQDKEATIQFDDGSVRQLVLPPDTKVRSFGSQDYGNTASLSPQDKIAIIGLTNSDKKIIPQFILKNVPKELPEQHQGTVIEINAGENTLKLLKSNGQKVTVRVDDNTDIKSRDTDVSLAGIKAGSKVAVFGVNGQTVNNGLNLLEKPSASAAISPSAPPSFKSSPVPSAGIGSTPTTISPPSNTNKTNKPSTEIKATSVTVTSNSSGSKEKTNKPSSPPPPAAASPKHEDKHEDKK